MQRLLLILGNQLFPVTHVKAQRPHRVYMSEDAFLCTHFRYHQQKLTLVLSAMRAYADALRLAGIEVDYQRLEDTITASAIPQPEDFGALQRRLGRKRPGRSLLTDCPAALISSDLLEAELRLLASTATFVVLAHPNCSRFRRPRH